MVTKDDRRLTKEQISTEYPDQWLALSNVQWDDRDDIKSAVVAYSHLTKNEATRLMAQSDTNEYGRHIIISYPTLVFEGTYAVLANE